MSEFEQVPGVAIVTGAAGGMGAPSARLLAEGGWNELILCDLNAERLEGVAAPLRSGGAQVEVLVGEITDPAFVEALVGKIGSRPISAFIHTAGVSPHMTTAERILEINLDATQALVDAVRPKMAQGGAAVLFASMAGYFATAPEADAAFEQPLPPEGTAALRHFAVNEGMAYTLSKRAVRAIARREAKAFGERGARINSMSPGLIDTPMGNGEWNDHTRAMLANSALPRLGRPEELAAAAVYLCSPQASFVTGIDLRVDGGALAAMGL